WSEGFCVPISIAPAEKADAAGLAVLADIAGHGLPSWLWQRARQKEGFHSVMEVGCERVLSEDHVLSHRRMVAAKVDGVLAGMLLDYPLDEPNSETDIAESGPVIGPLLKLENRVSGCWYVNMLAVFRQYRGMGVGRRLLEESRNRAVASVRREMGVIVEDDNPARRLYEAFGFETAGSEPFAPFAGSLKQDGEWVVMRRPITGER
ncbi:MAG: GNAT family N-acetyltransferase, partial [Rhizobiaceae bacterium]|nr:GNAT family N-acetyltransferase [Rhizobiaceae bacterium]